MVVYLKTKEVSEQLQVNPTTVQRWIKYFHIPCETNELGHYLITNEQMQLLSSIKNQLNDGLTMKEILEANTSFQRRKEQLNETKEMVSTAVFNEKLEQLMIYVEQLERKLSVKADEVVEYQVLQHRSELDKLFTIVTSIEERMTMMEKQLIATNTNKQIAVGQNESKIPSQIKKSRKNKFMRIFSF